VTTQENETDPQSLDAEALARRVRAVRRTTLALVSDLSDEQLDLPYAATVNPMRWELGHVGFFYDCFLLSELDGGPTRFEGGADLFDSFEVDHADRWSLALPSREKTFDYLEQIEQ
jgi:iron(II)-dependent oxidoreductase